MKAQNEKECFTMELDREEKLNELMQESNKYWNRLAHLRGQSSYYLGFNDEDVAKWYDKEINATITKIKVLSKKMRGLFENGLNSKE